MTQLWIALIANLIFTVIFQRNKQAEAIVTIVSMARSGLNTSVCFLTIIRQGNLNSIDRDNRIIQLQLFQNKYGGIFQNENKSP